MSRPRHKPKAMEYLACYALYVLFLALTGLLFLVCQTTTHLVVDLLVEDAFVNRFVYMAALIVLGLATLVLAISAEHYLHTGVQRRRLLGRFFRLVVSLAGVGVVCLVLRQLLFTFALG